MKAEVAQAFKIQGDLKGKHEVNGFGVIDFDKISLEDAKAYHKAGCQVFIPKSKAETAEAKADAKKIDKT